MIPAQMANLQAELKFHADSSPPSAEQLKGVRNEAGQYADFPVKFVEIAADIPP